jgi:hypothetical protein
VIAVAGGSSKSHVVRRDSQACWDIGFTNSSNPFYLFSKLNAGLLLWAPSAPTMQQKHPLLVALEADRWTLMSITAPAEPVALLTIDETDGSQIARPKFVDEHGFFTVGGR